MFAGLFEGMKVQPEGIKKKLVKLCEGVAKKITRQVEWAECRPEFHLTSAVNATKEAFGFAVIAVMLKGDAAEDSPDEDEDHQT